MFNLSLTACSFHFRKTNSKGNTQVYDLNAPLCIKNADDDEFQFSDLSQLFCAFFEKYKTLVKDDNKQQSFRCEYRPENCIQTPDFKMLYVKIYSGIYGSSSDIIDGDTQEIKYQKTSSDIDTRPFYLMIVFPKDSDNVIVQKGNIVLSILIAMFFSVLSILSAIDGQTRRDKYQQLLTETFTTTIFEIILCLLLLLISFIVLFIGAFEKTVILKIVSGIIYYLTIVAILNILVIIKRIKVLFDNK